MSGFNCNCFKWLVRVSLFQQMRVVFFNKLVFLYFCATIHSLEIADLLSCKGDDCYRKYASPENATTKLELSISSLRGVSESQMGAFLPFPESLTAFKSSNCPCLWRWGGPTSDFGISSLKAQIQSLGRITKTVIFWRWNIENILQSGIFILKKAVTDLIWMPQISILNMVGNPSIERVESLQIDKAGDILLLKRIDLLLMCFMDLTFYVRTDVSPIKLGFSRSTARNAQYHSTRTKANSKFPPFRLPWFTSLQLVLESQPSPNRKQATCHTLWFSDTTTQVDTESM